jgi:DNA repair protein RadC
MAVRILDLPESDRPRERLARVGLSGLSDAELIALVIRSGGAARSALDVGRQLLADRGSIQAVGTARPEELGRIGSIGAAKAASLAAAFELGRRAATPSARLRRVSRPEDIVRAVLPAVTDPRREEVFVLILDAGNRLLRLSRLGGGAASRCHLAIDEILRATLRSDGAAFALAHTHPSGNVEPSPEDLDMTCAVAAAAVNTGLRFVDHVIVAGERWAPISPAMNP